MYKGNHKEIQKKDKRLIITSKAFDILSANLISFANNVESFRLEEEVDEAFRIYIPQESETSFEYFKSIEYLDGWLWGVVQGINRKELKGE